MKKKQGANCEYCVNYSYDDDYECYTCDMNLDEDEMYRFITGTYHDCPYFRMGDEYRVCLLYTSPSPRDISGSRMPSSA